jgi:hypothetical protein
VTLMISPHSVQPGLQDAGGTRGQVGRGIIDDWPHTLRRGRSSNQHHDVPGRGVGNATQNTGRCRGGERLVNEPVDAFESVNRALLEALACREDRKRAEQALESVRRKENDATERLQELVRARQADVTVKPAELP